MLSAKIANDANDVLYELTLNGGREMWTPEKWELQLRWLL